MNNKELAYKELQDELKEINKQLDRVKGLEQRKYELVGSSFSRNNNGAIERARIAAIESKLPIYSAGKWNNTRIFSVDKKWITLKSDGNNEKTVTRFKIENGWKERSRDSYGAIDVASALKLWEGRDK